MTLIDKAESKDVRKLLDAADEKVRMAIEALDVSGALITSVHAHA